MHLVRTAIAALGVACVLSHPVAAQRSQPRSKLEQALVAADKALRAGKPAETITILQKADRTTKDPRTKKLLSYAYQKRGATYFRSKKLDLAYRNFFAANRLTPNQEGVLQSLGVLTYELGRKRDAESYMQRVLKLNPKNTEALGILGRLAKGRDNVAAASKYFSRAAKEEPGRKDYQRMATKLGKEADVEKKFVTLDKGNFRLQFQRGKTVGVENAMRTVHSYLEQAHRDLAAQLGGRPNKRIIVVVYNDSQFRRVSSAHSWVRAYYDGKVRVALKGWPAGRSQLRKDLRHELTHAFLRELFKDIPTWLHEGLAQKVEGKSVAFARGLLRRPKAKLLPVDQFLGDWANTKNAAVAQIGYSQSLVFVDHLMKLGNRRQIQSLCRAFRRNRDSEKAVRLVYRKSVAELLQAAMK